MTSLSLVRLLTTGMVVFGSSTAAFSERTQGFEHFAGGWAGEGSVRLSKGGIERVRCQGSYTPAGPDRLDLHLACASDSLKVQLTSEMSRQGEQLQGTWREATFGVSGSLDGQIKADHIDATISGLGVSARLSLAIRGNTQIVSLATQSSQFSGTTNVTLHRR